MDSNRRGRAQRTESELALPVQEFEEFLHGPGKALLAWVGEVERALKREIRELDMFE